MRRVGRGIYLPLIDMICMVSLSMFCSANFRLNGVLNDLFSSQHLSVFQHLSVARRIGQKMNL